LDCPNCGAANPEGQKFCGDCGARLAAACPTCGTVNAPGQRYCGECGTALAGAGPTTAQAAGVGAGAGVSTPAASGPLAERRFVSVLFADLVGFTPFAEERDAEDVRETLSRYFELASEIVARYGGTLEKFIGDAVMAVWGAPVAREDDAERAVRAALELVDGVDVLGPAIQARAGVLSGEAAVTLGATNQGLVAGDLVNTAARLQSVAPPGTVLVGEATHRAASLAIAFEEAGEQLLKGKAAPVPAWRALRVVAQRGGQGRSALPEPPFVGRDEEVRLLKDLVIATGRDGRARLVSVTGPAGIGKSRLAWEFEKYLDGPVETIYWHRGRSPAYGDGITFWALGEMVSRRAGLAEADDEATTRARIGAMVSEFVPALEDRRWVEPALLTLLGLEPAPAGGRDVLFAAWRIFFERIAARATAVLLFEDLQWADSGLLDFIEYLLEWARSSPLLIVTLSRPELLDKRPDWGASARNFSSLALEPLSDAAMGELLAGFVPGLPAAAVEAILARADGVPLYAVETVRALVAEGRLERVAGGYRPVDDLTHLAIPDTLRSLIASRLDTLEPADRSLLQDAAVLGQTFTLGGLSAMSGAEPAELERRLRALVRRELLELEVDPRSPERGQYGFVQSLIREVAYGTLARRERRARHLSAARYFESLGEEELAGALASHLLAAHEASAAGPEADAVAIQARLALKGAAERAATLGAHDQAVAYLRQALEVTGDPAERAPLERLAAVSASLAADHDAAETLARAAVDDYRAAGVVTATAAAIAGLGSVLLSASKIQQAVPTLEDALHDLPDEAPPEVRARLLVDLARALMRSSDPVRSLGFVDQALDIAERLELVDVVADGLNNKAAALGYLGRRREAVALMDAAVATAHEAGLINAELRARSNLSSLLWGHDPRRAYELQRANLELARRVGDRQIAIWIAGPVTAGAWLAGDDWDAALALVDEILGLVRTRPDEAGLRTAQSFILTSRGVSPDATLALAEAVATEAADPADVAQAHLLRADRAFLSGDLRTAAAERIAAADFAPLAHIYLDGAMRSLLWSGALEEARAVADRMIALPGANGAASSSDIRAARAGIAALEGRRDEALALYLEVFRETVDFGMHYAYAERVLDAVKLLGADTPRLREDALEARAIFTRLRATPYLAWLDEAFAAIPSEPAARGPAREHQRVVDRPVSGG
jgi:class 3 adenylate cyclase/tetratricopeptide (TPR) repeat protein